MRYLLGFIAVLAILSVKFVARQAQIWQAIQIFAILATQFQGI
ncbi:hypothetical protein CSUNSWCD_532 [Campylobacter showae CSUNSWCD]|uniref:Uncharacterized protein n=1 Tax=Campylobacter showae CSUNSWCD TaxID=1244083 RepID=M5IPN6_9BACT|nr:hypothetical protein CSUNSWCD_532 [Campylobacter showae CSUNSWCD]